ncbi:glutathione peroxidase [Corynebacterium felinum]|uniref:Glutathione peroxidase n=1 Tax=Corynebacterium felinum TaxID=131318 RepID=A0ABU2B562_9CORY|nr:glutathione peroxidase [Corynebacterium felinum]MDF5821660.1 glutathione peroxidase [Corynebacterium felinum]MDR7353748.1 glutathione peroxidase [Corynebacterium felinum]WJY95927.1 Hydroperoxy fatty acid reductase gpx1 [Corynebacterium felinum]
MSIYDIPVTLNDGTDTTMGAWEGHLLLIVNTASRCGYTPQLETLQELFDDYAPRGLFVIGVPCNQFADEEPGTDKQIACTYSEQHGVTFPVLKKCDVNGPNQHPLYEFLKGEGPDIEWNFEKFLVSPSGEVIGRFAPGMEPDEMPIIDLFEQHLPL